MVHRFCRCCSAGAWEATSVISRCNYLFFERAKHSLDRQTSRPRDKSRRLLNLQQNISMARHIRIELARSKLGAHLDGVEGIFFWFLEGHTVPCSRVVRYIAHRTIVVWVEVELDTEVVELVKSTSWLRYGI